MQSHLNVAWLDRRGHNLQVTPLSRAAAIAFCRGQVTKACGTAPDPGFVAQNNTHGLFFCPCNLCFSPARRTPRIFVLDKEM